MIRKEILIVLITFCLTATLFSIIPVGSQGIREYDPWYDVTGPIPNQSDGKIDLRDYYAMGLKFGTEGDPTRNVSVTNWPDWMLSGEPSSRNGLNVSLGSFHLSTANYSQFTQYVQVDGYKTFYLYMDIYASSSHRLYVDINYKAGGVELVDFSLAYDPPYHTTHLEGPYQIKGPEIRIRLAQEYNAADKDITLAMYALP